MNLTHEENIAMTQDEAKAVVERWTRQEWPGVPRVSDLAEVLGASEGEINKILADIRHQPIMAPPKRRFGLGPQMLVWSNVIFAVALVLAGPKKSYFESRTDVFGDYYVKGCAWDTIALDLLLFALISTGGYFFGKVLFSFKKRPT